MSKSVNNLKVLIAALLVNVPLLSSAQTPFDDNTLDNPAPFDSGTCLLVAAIIGYALKKANDKKRTDQF